MATNKISKTENSFIDDSWWESILAEDENSFLHSSSIYHHGDVQKQEKQINWDRAVRIHHEDEIVALLVVGYNRGGLLVESESLAGFVPFSHLVNLSPGIAEKYREECLLNYIGNSLELKIIECVPDEDRIVFSERAAKSIAGRRTEIFNCLKAGQVVAGEVTNITNFGVFVDLGGVEGLVHISEISWGRVIHPEKILQLGEKVEVLVLEVVPERCRIALSLKRLTNNPWENAETRYPHNTVVPAVITTLVPFGAFAKLEDGLEGLIHLSEIPIPSNLTLRSFLALGQKVDVRILQVDSSRQRLGLSMKLNY